MSSTGLTTAFYRLCILLLLFSCSSEGENGTLIFRESNPEAGFNFPYFLYIPTGTDTTAMLPLIVEPNNSGFASDDLQKHIDKAKRIASMEFYSGNYVAQKLKLPLLVPVFPRPESTWQIYTHAFDRDVAIQKNNELERPDLQLISMMNDAGKLLNNDGYNLDEKCFLTGFSASGTFANRFTAIHPEKVKAVAAGGLNGLLILPIPEADGLALNYPVGVNDFGQLFNKTFNDTAFRETPQFLYMGELDDNDAIPFDDGYSPEERTLIYSLLGKEMQPERWNSCKEIYEHENIRATIKTFPGCGHEQPEEIKDEIVQFFSACLND